ncbi:MAG: hypothetical protein U0931_41255 [Vulcanimicrobiota bacterium]
MQEVKAKSGSTYLEAYHQRARVKAFDQSPLDSNSEVDQVCVDQFLQQPRATRLILKGQLGQGTLSLESIPSDRFNRRPATSLNFQAQGGLLLVQESSFEFNHSEGRQSTFSVDFATGAISELRQQTIRRPVAEQLEPGLRTLLESTASEIDSLAYTITQPWK